MSTRKHRSFRFDQSTLDRLEQRARVLGMTQTELVERYVDEGLRQEDHPHIVFVDEAAGRRARVGGTGLDVWQVVLTVRDNEGSVAAAADYLDVPERYVMNAMRYYADYPDEVDFWIDETYRLFDEHGRQMKRVADALA